MWLDIIGMGLVGIVALAGLTFLGLLRITATSPRPHHPAWGSCMAGESH